MDNQQVIEGNRLIAEFMGAEYERKKDAFDDRYHETMTFIGTPGNWRGRNDNIRHQYLTMHLLYDKDWDWLMPVVEKIESLENSRFGFTMDPHGVEVLDYANRETTVAASLKYGSDDTRIFLLYDCVVSFIRWYNSLTPNTNKQ